MCVFCGTFISRKKQELFSKQYVFIGVTMSQAVELRGLMYPPIFFDVWYNINPQMRETLRSGKKIDKVLAFEQWMRSVFLLQNFGVKLYYPPAHPDFPDMTFAANAGFPNNGGMILSNFRHPERRGESAEVRSYFSQILGIPVTALPLVSRGSPVFFEGQGDALWYGNTLICGYGFRSNKTGVMEIHGSTRWGRFVSLELTHEHFYHLDTCFCPLGEDILWYPPAFSHDSRTEVESIISKTGNLVEASEEDAMRLACNGIYFSFGGRRVLITSPMSLDLRLKIEKLGVEVWGNNVSEFLKSGGGNKCLFLSF